MPSGASGTSSVDSIVVSYGTSAITGNIKVKASNACGVRDSTSKAITVNPLPVAAGIITGLDTICKGQNSVVYKVPMIANATSYTWSLPSDANGTSSVDSIVVSYGMFANTGNITVKGNNACGDGVSSFLLVYVNLNASVASVTGSDSLCINNTAQYSANSVVLGGNGIGTWSSSDTTIAKVNINTGMVTAKNAGFCIIKYTITGGCNGTPSAQKSITILPDASISSVTGISTLCILGSSTYNADNVVLGGGVGNWSSSNSTIANVNVITGLVTAINPGICNIIYTITGGCNATPSEQQSITVFPDASIASVTGSSPLCINSTAQYLANTVDLGGNGIGTWSSSDTTIAKVNSGLVTAKNAGTCNIIYTVTGGCNGTPSKQQALIVTPNVGTPSTPSPSATTICQGSANTTYTTLASNATAYNWSVTGTGNTISGSGVTGTVSWASDFYGIATVKVSSNGCNGPSDTISTIINVLPTPVPATIALKFGSVLVYPDSSLTSYQWGYDKQSGEEIVLPLCNNYQFCDFININTNLYYYWVKITKTNNCIVKVYYNSPVTIIETDTESSFVNIYPNPTNGKFTVEIKSNAKGNAEIIIRDLTGRNIDRFSFSKTENTQELNLNKNHLKNGIYLIDIYLNKNFISTKKIVVAY